MAVNLACALAAQRERRVLLIDSLGFGHANVVVAVPQAWIDVRTMTDLDDVTSGSSCLANAYSSNHDVIVAKDTGTIRAAALHAVALPRVKVMTRWRSRAERCSVKARVSLD